MSDCGVLFAAHGDGVFRYLSRIIGARDAQDLTQEVFLRISRTQVPDTSADGERAWVFRIARNLVLNYRRDARRRPLAVELIERPQSAGQEIALAVREALDRLSPLDRDVFLLREAAGLTYDEIGAACDLTADAVRSRLHRARQQLRATLASSRADSRSISTGPRLI